MGLGTPFTRIDGIVIVLFKCIGWVLFGICGCVWTILGIVGVMVVWWVPGEDLWRLWELIEQRWDEDVELEMVGTEETEVEVASE